MESEELHQDTTETAADAAPAVDPFRLLADDVVLTDDPEAQAMAALLGGEIRSAPRSFEEVAESCRDRGDMRRVAAPLSAQALALVHLDRSHEAMRCLREALELSRNLGQDLVEAFVLWHRSEAQSSLGRHDDAMASAEAILSVADRLDRPDLLAPAWRAVGLAHAGAGSPRAALAAHHRSLEAGRDRPLFECWAHARLALLHLRLEDAEAAAGEASLALSVGPPLAQYEARLAGASVAAHRHDAAARRLIADARRRALDGGDVASARLLATL